MAYSVTKAAELSLSRAFADAYAGRGVLVNAVAPGPIAGELWLADGGLADQNARRARGDARGGAWRGGRRACRSGGSGPSRRSPTVIVFLCSEPASNVAGAAWSVDGGAVPVII